MKRIGIFGGSFNPVHNGHVNIARRAIAELQLDRLLVIPAAVSPFKTGEEFFDFSINRFFDLKDGSKTIEKSLDATIEESKNRRIEESSLRLFLLRAAFSQMPRVVIDDRELRRGGVSYSIDTVREIHRELAAERAADANHEPFELIFLVGEDSLAGLPRWRNYDELVTLCTFKSFPRTPESSTEVRRRLAAGESVADLLPPAIVALLGREVS